MAKSFLPLFELFNRLFCFRQLILFSGFFLYRVNLLLNLRLLFLELRHILFTSLFQILNFSQCFFIWHQRFDRYKFLEFQILDVVLSVLVNVEGVKILEEDIFRVAYFLDRLALCIFLLGCLGLIPKAHLHKGHLA